MLVKKVKLLQQQVFFLLYSYFPRFYLIYKPKLNFFLILESMITVLKNVNSDMQKPKMIKYYSKNSAQFY